MAGSFFDVVQVSLKNIGHATDGECFYALPVDVVREVVRVPENFETIRADHQAVIGLFEMHEIPVPIIDLSMVMGGQAVVDRSEDQRLVVVETLGRRAAFLVDEAHRIRPIEKERLLVKGGEDRFVSGLTKFDESHYIYVLDVDRIFLHMEDGPQASAPIGHAPIPKSDYDVLLIDDVKALREFARAILEQGGFRVREAAGGEEALSFLLQGAKPKAIVSDIEMPGMSGIALTREIKSRPYLATIPVFLFSSLTEENIMEEIKSCGADGFVAKSDVESLVDLILKRVGHDSASTSA